jgi:hypothetical protein
MADTDTTPSVSFETKFPLDTDVLEDQLRDCFGRTAYSHKTHEKMADGCTTALRRIKLWQLILALISTGTIALTFLIDETFMKVLATLISAGTAFLAGYTKSFDPGGTSQKHRETANALWGIRESYLSLITDLRGGAVTDQDARKKRDALQSKLESIYKSAPRTNAKAYKAAQDALQLNEELTFSSSEIDRLLPHSLRKTERT